MISLVIIPLRICRRRTKNFGRTPTNVHVKARRNDAAGRNVHVRRGTNMNFTYGCTGPPLIMTNSTANIVHSTANIVHSTANIVHSTANIVHTTYNKHDPIRTFIRGLSRRNEC